MATPAARQSRKSTPQPAARTPELPAAIGDVIADKYRLERIVGAGGVGVVFAAEHLGLGERVAIKLLQRSASQSKEALARFDREARALARVKSEHVARIMDIGSLPTGEPFMVMELLEGEDFAVMMKRRGKLPLAEAAEYVLQACEAVALSHGVGVVHRDLKPANLFLTSAKASESASSKNVVKVLDFGISKLRGPNDAGRDQAMTQTMSVIGSPLYMSPEQMESPRDADERADVWSLGVIFYELLAGEAPFDAPTLPALCARICTAAPTPLSTHGVQIPAGCERVLLRCLEKDPNKRYASVHALATELRDALAFPSDAPESTGQRRLAWESSPPPARHATTGEFISTAAPISSPRPRRFRRYVAAFAVFALLGLTAGTLRSQSGPEPVSPLAAWSDNVVLHARLQREMSLRERAERAPTPAAAVEVTPAVGQAEPVVTAPEPSASASASPALPSSAPRAKQPLPPRTTVVAPASASPAAPIPSPVVQSPKPVRPDDVLRER